MDDKLISTLRVLEQTSKGQMKYDILEGKTVIEQMVHMYINYSYKILKYVTCQ